MTLCYHCWQPPDQCRCGKDRGDDMNEHLRKAMEELSKFPWSSQRQEVGGDRRAGEPRSTAPQLKCPRCEVIYDRPASLKKDQACYCRPCATQLGISSREQMERERIILVPVSTISTDDAERLAASWIRRIEMQEAERFRNHRDRRALTPAAERSTE